MDAGGSAIRRTPRSIRISYIPRLPMPPSRNSITTAFQARWTTRGNAKNVLTAPLLVRTTSGWLRRRGYGGGKGGIIVTTLAIIVSATVGVRATAPTTADCAFCWATAIIRAVIGTITTIIPTVLGTAGTSYTFAVRLA